MSLRKLALKRNDAEAHWLKSSQWNLALKNIKEVFVGILKKSFDEVLKRFTLNQIMKLATQQVGLHQIIWHWFALQLFRNFLKIS